MATVKVTNESDLNLGQNNNLGTPSYSKTLYFVEPLDGLPVDNKDLFIYANLTATRKARSLLYLTEESSPQIKSVSTNKTEINLIGYRQEIDGSRIMTTDWATKMNLGKITDLDPNNTQGTFEGFGLESIDINITAMNPPVVNIKFIDTRGGGLFDQESFNENAAPINAFQNNSSPYGIFFELPPPLFYLTLKGFYGNPVTLCLYLMKWDGTFNSETGNFEISANFLGYTFAFLQDIRIGHLIAAGNTEEGRQKLEQVSRVPTQQGLFFPIITLDDLAIRLKRITVLREEQQKNSNEFEKLRVVNDQIKYLKQFKSYLGFPASDNLINNLEGSNLFTQFLTPNRQQIFFRDVGIILSDAATNYDQLGKLIEDGLKKYEEFRTGQQGQNPYKFIDGSFLTKGDVSGGGFEFEFSKYSQKYDNISNAIDRVNEIIQDDNDPDKNIPLVTTASFTGRTQNKWPLNTNVVVVNLQGIRKILETKLQSLIQEKELAIQNIEKEIERQVEQTLGFTPSIQNLIGILCNNIEMFLNLIYDVGLSAQKKGEQRYANLAGGYGTDSPEFERTIYPFPKVVNKEYKEIYLGEIESIDESLFPEIEFINKLSTALAYSLKENKTYSENTTKNKNVSKKDPFPINSSDIGYEAYVGVDGLPSNAEGQIAKESAEAIIRRPFLASRISKYNDASLNKIAGSEAANLYETLITEAYKNLYNNITPEQILNVALENNIIQQVNVGGIQKYKFYLPLETSPKPFEIDYNGSTNSGNRIWNDIVILKDLVAKEFLTKQGNTEKADFSSFTSRKRTETYVKRYFDSTNCYLNKSYLSLKTFKDDSVKNSILIGYGNLDSANLLLNYSFNTLRTIPIGLTGQFYFDVPYTVVGSVGLAPALPKPITKTPLFQTSNDFGKAYLILSSFQFEDEKVLFDEIDSDYSKIIRLPWYYLLWLGANYYRFNNSEILNFDLEFPAVPKNQYYYVSTKTSNGNSDNRIASLMEKYFIEWVNSEEFFDIKNLLGTYLNVDNISQKQKDSIVNTLNKYFFREYDLLINNPDQFLYGTFDQTIDTGVLTQYLNTFVSKYKIIYNEQNKDNKNQNNEQNVITAITDVVGDPDIKNAFYLDLKHIYDNWIAGNPSSVVYTCCKTIGNKSLKLFDLFKFVDKFRNSIAGDAIANINSFNDLINKKDVGLYSFVSKLLTDSYFMHFNLPIYVEFNKPDKAKAIFEPQTTLDNDVSNSPNLLCVYNGPPSSKLSSTRNYTNDSFKFNVPGSIPPSVYGKFETGKASNSKQNDYLVAFNVNYGSQTQSIFKNVQVSTQESKTTGEYISLLSDYVTQTGAAKPLLKDNSIFSLQRNRSYTSTIQMLGDMMIQPQMYYQLNNIPFFSGSYMIMNVSHSIKPNSMYTTFKGVRQNNSPVKIVTNVTTFLNFQYDQGTASGFTITPYIKLSGLTETSENSKTPANVSKKTIENYKPGAGKTILRGFEDGIEKHYGIDIELQSSTTQVKTTNVEGVVFYNVVGISLTDGPQEEPKYTFDIPSFPDGDTYDVKIYNNGILITTESYPKFYEYGNLPPGDISINAALLEKAERYGFYDRVNQIQYSSYQEFRRTGLPTSNNVALKDKIKAGVLILKHPVDEDGFTYYTGYYGLWNNYGFNDGAKISKNSNIGLPSTYKDKFYYHYEIRRTNNPDEINSYADYIAKAIPVTLPNDLEFKNYVTPLHENITQ